MFRDKWEKYKIEDIIHKLYDGPHATPKPSDIGPVFLGIKNISEDNRIDLSDIRHISEEDFPKWTKRVLPQKDDLVFVYEATLGRYALIPENLRCCLGRRMALMRLNKEKVDPNFLLYYFGGSEWEQTVDRNLIVGATVNRIPISEVPQFELSLPPLPTQKKIAKVLSDLDAKIELNNRINSELEAMAKLLYDYWFVQFDFPNAEGKPYKSSGGEMVYNEELKREIPKGWEVKELGEYVKCNYSTLRKDEIPDEIQYLDTGNLTENILGEVRALSTAEKIPSRAQRLVNEGDVLYSSVRPNLRHHGIIKLPLQNMVASTGFIQLTSSSSYLTNDFIYMYLTSDWITHKLDRIANSSVSAYPSISPNDILSLRITLPSDKTLLQKTSFHETHLLQHQNQNQNQQLSSLRDWLLPMLMNGQVSVGEAAEKVREVVG